jgi:hypothetical protein
MKALNKWSKMPVDYAVVNDAHGIVLQGKCALCGRSVARYVED